MIRPDSPLFSFSNLFLFCDRSGSEKPRVQSTGRKKRSPQTPFFGWGIAVVALSLGLFAIKALFSRRPVMAATSVFINEIHYDNTGTDAGEAIEVAGPAGTNLSGWSIVLYNGSGGAAYDTKALSGTIPNQQAGFGTLHFTYPVNGIQNGSPDGMALVNGATV